jgi:hypothetical protein
VTLLESWGASAKQQLQDLDKEFDFPNAPQAEFDIGMCLVFIGKLGVDLLLDHL